MASFPSFTAAYHKTAQPYTSPTLPRNSAAGKTVLVTGGGRGIGLQIATAFVEAGAAHVVILGRSQATLDEAKGVLEQQQKSSSTATKIHGFSADVSSPEAMSSTFTAAVDATGKRGIDICIANAGYTPDALVSTTQVPLDQFWRAYEVNVKGVLNIITAFMANTPRALSEKGNGSGKYNNSEELPVLIDINTGMAHLEYFGPFSAYASSKAAAAKLLEYVQAEEEGKVRMHNLQPGIIKTEMGSKGGVPDEMYDDSMSSFS